MTRDMQIALFAVGLFAMGGVALVLYQHSLHTGQVVAAMGASKTPMASRSAPNVDPAALMPASLSGMPTPGQTNLDPGNPSPLPLVTGAAWGFSGSGFLN